MSFEPPSTGSTVAVFHVSSSECKYWQEFICVETKYPGDDGAKDMAKEVYVRAYQHISSSWQDPFQLTVVHRCSSADNSKELTHTTYDMNRRETMYCPCLTTIVKTTLCRYKCYRPRPTKLDGGVRMEKIGWLTPENVARLQAVCKAVPLPTEHQSKSGEALDKVPGNKPMPADHGRDCSDWAAEVISAMWEADLLVPLRPGEGEEPIRLELWKGRCFML